MITEEVGPFIARVPMSIREVLELLNESGRGILFAVDSELACIGAISDGDIRRALLAGATLEQDASTVLRKDILTASLGVGLQDLVDSSGARGVDHIPILDTSGRIDSVFVRDQSLGPVERDNIVVVMAGGLGLRLRPITSQIPKPMIEVAGKPIIRHIVDKFAREGFRNFLISINYLGEKIEDYFGDGRPLGLRIEYLRETEPLGTAGSLTLFGSQPKSPVIVVNGDILLAASPSAMLEHHVSHGADLTVGAKVVETEVPYGVIETDGLSIRAIAEKPTYQHLVSAGIYVLEPRVIMSLPRGRYVDMPEVVQEVALGGSAQVFPLFEDWLDIGRPSDLSNAKEAFDAEKQVRTIGEKGMQED